MSIAELVHEAQIFVNTFFEKREESEDADEIKRQREAKQEYVPWEQAKTELRNAGKSV